MSRAKNHEWTYLFRHRQDMIEKILAIDPGEYEEFFFETNADAVRFRGRLYSFVPAYCGHQKFVIAIVNGTTVKVINPAGEAYAKNKEERDSTVSGNEGQSRDEGGERE